MEAAVGAGDGGGNGGGRGGGGAAKWAAVTEEVEEAAAAHTTGVAVWVLTLAAPMPPAPRFPLGPDELVAM
jgi:hypothetical protein